MSEGDFEKFKTPALGRWIARAFVTLGLARPPRERQEKKAPQPFDYLRAVGRLTYILAPIWLCLIGLVLWSLYDLAITGLGDFTPTDRRWHVLSIAAMIAALGGLLGAPLAIIRVFVTERQTRTTEESLFNAKFNTANEGLSSRRQVTRSIVAGGEERILTEWEDDLVARNTAIEALEGLAKENPKAADRIARILSVYVREMSRE